jgi:hypothetical protein
MLRRLPVWLIAVLIVSLLPMAGPALARPPARPSLQDAPPALPAVALTADGVVRAWPDSGADALGVIPARSSVPVSGRTQDFAWWQIPFSAGPGGYAWLAATVVLPNSTAATVPAIQVIRPTPAPATPTPAPTPQTCTLDAAFVADVTIPDGTIVPPAQPAHKVWRLRNTGTCPWDDTTVLRFVSGFQMGAPLTVTFPATQPGATADVGMTAFAPSQPGVYRGIWQLLDDGINFFGPQLTVVIQVSQPGPPRPPTPVPPPPSPAGPSVSFWADSTRLNAGKCTVLHWDVRNVQAVYLQYAGKTRGVAGQSAQTVCPSVDGQDFVLRVVKRDGGQDARSIHIDLNNPPPGPVSIDFGANPPSLLQQTGGQCTSVYWRVWNATRVEYQGRGAPGNGAQTECPQKTTTYRLRVTDLSGKVHDRTVSVNVHWGGLVTPQPGPVYPTPRPGPMPGPVYPTQAPPMPGPVYPTQEPPMPGPVYPTEEPMPGPVYPDNDGG